MYRDPDPDLDRDPQTQQRRDCTDALIYLGAIFILAGIGTDIGMFWNRMGSVMRIVVTLGVCLYALLVVLVSALHEEVSQARPAADARDGVHADVAAGSSSSTRSFRAATTGGWWCCCSSAPWRFDQGLLFRQYASVLAFTALCFVYAFLSVGLDLLDVPAGLSALSGASSLLVASGLKSRRSAASPSCPT